MLHPDQIKQIVMDWLRHSSAELDRDMRDNGHEAADIATVRFRGVICPDDLVNQLIDAQDKTGDVA